MTHPVLGKLRFLASWNAIAAKVIRFQVRGCDGEHIAFPHSGRKPLPGMRRVFTRVRTAVHIDAPFAVPGEEVQMESDQPLRRLIDFSPDSDVAEPAHC